MGGMSGRRQAAVGAFAVVALWLIGFFLVGQAAEGSATRRR